MSLPLFIKSHVLSVMLCLITVPEVQAHEIDLVQLDYRPLTDPALSRLAVTLSPRADVSALPEWPDNCEAREEPQSRQSNQRVYVIRCETATRTASIARLPWGTDGSILHLQNPDGSKEVRLRPGNETGVTLSLYNAQSIASPMSQDRGVPGNLADFVRLGAGHVLNGWDHLTFVLCLFLLGGGVHLFWRITAFTLGHSLSLAMATLGAVTLPIGPTEAVIALSIVFLAREAAVCQRSGMKPGRSSAYATVAGFGLLHGLGFASALREIGDSTRINLMDLIGFNLGVELGQLLFVAALGVLFGLAKLFNRGLITRLASLYMAGALGTYWVAVRIASL